MKKERRRIKRQDPWVRFQKYVSVEENGCWLWIGHKNNKGYGHFGLEYKLVLAHRFCYAHLRGPIPEGLDLDHLCRVPACVNPWHLEPVSRRTNLRRGAGYKTHAPCGHPYNHVLKDGSRQCRPCTMQANRDRANKRYAAKKAAKENT